MKKTLIPLMFMLLIFFNPAIAADCPDCKIDADYNSCFKPKEQQKAQECEKCIVEDDEYCIYNQCYFDKQYRLMKSELSLNAQQEECIDNIYRNFKTDLEILCARYQCEKERLLELIAQDGFYSSQKHLVKDIKQDIKEKYKDYIKDVRENLCKKQKKKYNKFVRNQNKKIKTITKYGAIYKFPCSSGCQN